MEEDGIQAKACKFPRMENGSARNDSSNNHKLGSINTINEENGELRKRSGGGGRGGGGGSDGISNRFHSWHHQSSRIIRVSRASGGKDRHSKVMTSKGLRDRRVRLSVTTAIQFYDLQDRLGYDQPSKAVEWLIKAASDAISELPSLNNTFPETPKQPSDERRVDEKCIDSADAEGDGEASFHPQNQNQSQNLSLSKSACSSTSETSKGSGGLSLSRSAIRDKARERARERAAKEKEKENDESCNNIAHHPQNNNNNVISMAQTSFTELLTGGINASVAATNSPIGSGQQNHHRSDEVDLFNKGATHQWSIAPMNYVCAGLLGGSSSLRTPHHHHHHQSSGFSGQIQLGNNLPQAMSIAPFGVQSESHSDQLQHFSFIPDHLMPTQQAPSGGGSEYNLNFTISSSNNSGGFAGFNSRGTLQSNSPSLLPHHLQRFSPLDGSSNLPFFIGAPAAPAMENHQHHQHQFSPELDGRLQLFYGDGSRHSDQKGKGKN